MAITICKIDLGRLVNVFTFTFTTVDNDFVINIMLNEIYVSHNYYSIFENIVLECKIIVQQIVMNTYLKNNFVIVKCYKE